jgi:hypothetical protein
MNNREEEKQQTQTCMRKKRGEAGVEGLALSQKVNILYMKKKKTKKKILEVFILLL